MSAARINAEWHRQNRMAPRASLDERLQWHLAHWNACACRTSLPSSIAAELQRRGLRLPAPRAGAARQAAAAPGNRAGVGRPATERGAVFRKLNLKGQRSIVVLDAPRSFDGELAALHGVEVRRELPRDGQGDFVLAFVTRAEDVRAAAARLAKAVAADAIVWFAYPKRSSRRYASEIDRDTGWTALGAHGFEAVRQVAIDEDWSALRFRRAEFIRTMKRAPQRAMSAEGRRRLAKEEKAR